MKKLITKIGVIQTFSSANNVSEIVDYLIIEMSDETFSFLNNIATIENPAFGEKVWKVNNIEFREYK